MSSEYFHCGADLGRKHPPFTCNRRVAHNGRCSLAHDRGSEEFDSAWAEYFAAHPEILASWNHQNGYWPPGHVKNEELAHG